MWGALGTCACQGAGRGHSRVNGWTRAVPFGASRGDSRGGGAGVLSPGGIRGPWGPGPTAVMTLSGDSPWAVAWATQTTVRLWRDPTDGSPGSAEHRDPGAPSQQTQAQDTAWPWRYASSECLLHAGLCSARSRTPTSAPGGALLSQHTTAVAHGGRASPGVTTSPAKQTRESLPGRELHPTTGQAGRDAGNTGNNFRSGLLWPLPASPWHPHSTELMSLCAPGPGGPPFNGPGKDSQGESPPCWVLGLVPGVPRKVQTGPKFCSCMKDEICAGRVLCGPQHPGDASWRPRLSGLMLQLASSFPCCWGWPQACEQRQIMAATGWKESRTGQGKSARGAPEGPLQPVLPSILPSLWLLPEGPRSGSRSVPSARPGWVLRGTWARGCQHVAGSEHGGSRDPGSGSGVHWGMSVFRGCWPSL